MSIQRLGKLGVLGAQGRMGRIVTRLLEREFSSRWELGAEWDRGASVDPLLACDAWIDFSSPEGLLSALEGALAQGKLPILITGSTGWTEAQTQRLHELTRELLWLQSFNFSLGVMALLRILETANPLLRSLGYDAVLTETHHRHKKDAPSGTAKMLQAALLGSEGLPVATHSIRAGEVVGDHEVRFYGDADVLTFTHHAQDRTIFARGALELAEWLLLRHRQAPKAKGPVPLSTYLDERQRAK